MNIRTSVLTGIAVVGGIGALLATNAESQVGVVKESVALQSANPGFSQSGNSNISGTARAGSFYGANLTVTAGAAAGKVLKSDATGNATWQDDGLTLPFSATSVSFLTPLITLTNNSQ